MDVEVSNMIRWIMCVISYSLKDGWNFKIVDKNIDGTLVLDDNGFCVLIDGEKTYVTPMYVIDLLIRSYFVEQDEYVYMSKNSFFEINYKMTLDTVFNSPSWVRIVYFIKRIGESYKANVGNNCFNYDYISFKKYLSNFSNTFYQDIIDELKSMNEKDIICLSNVNSCLTRKIESLYYVEALLQKYMEDEIIDEINYGSVDKQNETVSVEDYRVELTKFFQIIKYRNDDNVLKSDLIWLNNKEYDRKCLLKSLLGLEDRVLPSSIEVTLALKNYNQRKKWMN